MRGVGWLSAAMNARRWTGAVLLCASAAGAALALYPWAVDKWAERTLKARLAGMFGARVELRDLHAGDGIVTAGRILIEGGPWPIARLDARGVRVPRDWRQIPGPPEETLHISAESVRVQWRGRDEARRGPDPFLSPPAMDILVEEFTFEQEAAGRWSAGGIRIRAVADAGGWAFSGLGGTAQWPGFEPWKLERFSAAMRAGGSEITGLRALGPRGGFAECFASFAPDGTWSGQAAWEGVPLEGMAPERITRHVQGTSSGYGTARDGAWRLEVELRDGVVQNIPPLTILAGLLPGEDWSVLPVQELSVEITRAKDGSLQLDDVDVLSSRGVSIQGAARLNAGRVSGTVEVGVSDEGRPGLREFVPVVFRGENDGYLWVTMKLGGTPDQPRENLSERVVMALGQRLRRATPRATPTPGEPTLPADGNVLRGLMRR
jgi:hypothetical protein